MREAAKNCLIASPILLAATFGVPSRVKGLLLAECVGVSLRYSDKYKISALCAAALMGRALLQQGGDVNDADPYGKTVLHNAVIHGRVDPDLLGLLLCAGADIEARLVTGFTSLHLSACGLGSGDATAALLRRGAAKDAIGGEGLSPVHCAVLRGDIASMRALLAAGADASLRTRDSLRIAPLELAAYRGRVGVVRELVRRGMDVDAADDHRFTALHEAAMKNEAAVLDALVVAGADVTAEARGRGITPLHLAVQYLCPEAVQELLRHEAPFVKGVVAR